VRRWKIQAAYCSNFQPHYVLLICAIILSAMRDNAGSLPLTNAPLQYAPNGEMGVVYLFANIAKKLQFRIEEIRAAYPDCIAYRQVGDREKMVKIEFEYRSSNFKAHRHNPKLCDCIVCWHHDWHDVPRRIEVIELKKFFGVPFKVWIQGAVKSEQHWLDDGEKHLKWVVSSRATEGDLLLMYRCSPSRSITDVFRFCGTGKIYNDGGNQGNRKAKYFYGDVERVCKLDAPIFLEEMRKHRVLRTSSFIRSSMRGRGGLLVSEYWPHLYAMLYARNPKHRRTLAKYAPEKLSA
jgi:hypothetical protein